MKAKHIKDVAIIGLMALALPTSCNLMPEIDLTSGIKHQLRSAGYALAEKLNESESAKWIAHSLKHAADKYRNPGVIITPLDSADAIFRHNLIADYDTHNNDDYTISRLRDLGYAVLDRGTNYLDMRSKNKPDPLPKPTSPVDLLMGGFTVAAMTGAINSTVDGLVSAASNQAMDALSGALSGGLQWAASYYR